MRKVLIAILLIITVIESKSQDTLNRLFKNAPMDTINNKANIRNKLVDLRNIESKMTIIDTSTKKLSTNAVITGDGTAIEATTTPVVMPSPNSASLTNLISDNVDLYTGKTNVNLPLYSLTNGKINLPISLQANVNAHRVNDIGSWTGLGWNLNAGGTVTRVMKSLPDEFTGTISNTFNIPGWGYTKLKSNQNVDLTSFTDTYPDIEQKKLIIHRGNWNVKNNQPDRGYDLQPDEFYFNFGNYSGKFVFDQDGNINLIPKTNLKITPKFEIINNINKITGFTILTEDGFKYEFGNAALSNYGIAPLEETKLTISSTSIVYTYRAAQFNALNNLDPAGIYVSIDGAHNGYYVYERIPYLLGAPPTVAYQSGLTTNATELACCLSNFSNPNNNETTDYFNYPSSWMLSKITSPTGEYINFNYSNSTTLNYVSDRSFSASIPDLVDDRYFYQPSTGNSFYVNAFFSPLKPIWDGSRGIYTLPVKHNFTKTESSIELKTKRLLSIVTSDNTTLNNHITINFVSNTAREDLLGDNRLDYLTVTNNFNDIVKKISFNYNVETTTSTDSPDEIFKFVYGAPRYNYHYWPTGGSSYTGMQSYFLAGNTSDFETPNNWQVPLDFRKRMFLSSIQEEANGSTLPPYIFSYQTGKLPYRCSTEQDFYGFANENLSRYPFASPHPANLLFYSHYYPYSATVIGNLRSEPAYINSFYKPILFFSTQNTNNYINGGNKNASVDKMKIGVLNKITYPTGGYKEFSFEFNGNANAWNGLRVNQIKEYESITANPIITNYNYGTFVNTDGVLMDDIFNKPTNNYTMVEAGEGKVEPSGVSFLTVTTRSFFSSSRINPENSTRGAAGGYNQVEVSQPNNGKTTTQFYTALDFPDLATITKRVSCYFTQQVAPMSFQYPFTASSSSDWKRGLPKKLIVYDQNYSELKTEEYIYSTNPFQYGQNEIPSLNAAKYNLFLNNTIIGPCGTLIQGTQWNWYLFAKHNYTSAWYPPIATISTQFGQSTTTTITYQKYNYNGIEYLFPRTISNMKDNPSPALINDLTYLKYPLDYNTVGGDAYLQGIGQLISKNVLNAKIEQLIYKQDPGANNKFIGGLLNKYHVDKPLIKEIFKLKTDGSLSSIVESNSTGGTFNFDSHYNSEVNFPTYDPMGRLLTQYKTYDIKESYIWNYNKMYPVAKVINAASNEIAYTGFEADEFGSGVIFQNSLVQNNATLAFTGNKYYDLDYPIGLNIPINNPGKLYKLSFWYKGDPIIMNNGVGVTPFPVPLKTRNGWNYYEYTVPTYFTGNVIIKKSFSGATTSIDDVRFYPVGAQMTTYTFTPLIGMNSESDVNGKTTYYEYDGLNRLSIVRNEDRDIVKTICYNYANQVVPCVSNCPAPIINSAVRTGGLNVTLDFTAPINSTSCLIEITDLNTGLLIPGFTGCTSPRVITIPTKLHSYSVTVISYSVQCPSGVRSLPLTF